MPTKVKVMGELEAQISTRDNIVGVRTSKMPVKINGVDVWVTTHPHP